MWVGFEGVRRAAKSVEVAPIDVLSGHEHGRLHYLTASEVASVAQDTNGKELQLVSARQPEVEQSIPQVALSRSFLPKKKRRHVNRARRALHPSIWLTSLGKPAPVRFSTVK